MRELAREALEELRSLVFELRPADARGRRAATRCASTSTCCGACTGRADRARRRRPAAAARRQRGRRSSGSRRRRCTTRCATPAPTDRRAARGDGNGGLELEVADDGAGFDPARRRCAGARLGLTSMEERAARARRDARHRARSPAPAPRVRLEVAGVIRVLLVDDHAVVRQGLRAFLDLQDDIEVVGEAGTARRRSRAAERCARRGPDGPRDAAAGRRRGDAPDPRAGARLARHRADELRRRRAAVGGGRAGAAGYLLKDVEPAELAAAIRAAHAGERAARSGRRGAAARGAGERRRRAAPADG